MLNTPLEPAQKPKRKSPTKGRKNPLPLKIRPVLKNPDLIPLRKAWELLQHLPGYHSLSSTRFSILKNKELPFERINNRGDVWVYAPAVHDMIGKHKNEHAPPAPVLSEDQKLIKHFREHKKNNYVTAVEAGLASTLAHAKHVYEEYLKAINDPLLLAIEAREAREAQLAKPETRCGTCDRIEKLAVEDDLRVIREVTNGREVLEMNEESVLSEYQIFRCKGCWHWRPHAPIAQMAKRLLEAPPAPAPAKSPAPTPAPTPEPTPNPAKSPAPTPAPTPEPTPDPVPEPRGPTETR